MGTRMAFARVTGMELDHGVVDPEWLRGVVRPGCELGAHWDAVQYLLDAAGVAVDLRVDGDPLDAGQTLAAWYPELVAEAAAALSGVPPELIVARHDPVRMVEVGIDPGDPVVLLECLRSLARFFADAAERGAGAVMLLRAEGVGRPVLSG
ncbi:DUF1877 family protein [Nocardia sp. NPDC057353]|uniref:DUF1877 family protein n=1 Tax=Nocardia sp. NPDC057353 TaxID=3346104 RepID=UPI00362F42BB